MPAKWQKEWIEIPEDLRPDDRQSLANDIIEFIHQRSMNGLDWRNIPFVDYTKQYAAKKGVSRSAVDLTLSGEMLSELKLISHRKGALLIGFDNGTDANAKADGNIRGSYGGSPNKKRARDFLGITQADLDGLLSGYDLQETD